MSGPVYDDPFCNGRAKAQPQEKMRTCSCCGETKEDSFFGYCRSGFDTVCRECWMKITSSGRYLPDCPICGGPLDWSAGAWFCPRCYLEPAEGQGPSFAESLDSIAGGLVEMLIKKNTDYGNSYSRLRDEFGPDSFLIRLGDKYNRLMSLRGREALVSESTDDTIRDIAGYCLLELAYRQRGGAS